MKLNIQKGDKFGRLKIIKLYSIPKNIVAKVQCSCGKIKVVRLHHILNHETKSCGCLKREIKANLKHGLYQSPLYGVYYSMVRRCCAKNHKQYKDYGGRGITICDEWKNDFLTFYNWAMDNGYEIGLTIDRIDNNGNYCPQNCRWTTAKIQSNNRRNNHKLTAFSETKTITEWSNDTRCKINLDSLFHRIHRGWPTELAIILPKGSRLSQIKT